jgi:hypothetical protein
MMTRIRTALIEHHVGAIAVGFLIAQLAIQIINGLMQPLLIYVSGRIQGEDRLRFIREEWNWGYLITPVVGIALYVLVIYLLLKWLYFPSLSTADTEPVDEETAEEQQ